MYVLRMYSTYEYIQVHTIQYNHVCRTEFEMDPALIRVTISRLLKGNYNICASYVIVSPLLNLLKESVRQITRRH